MTTAADKGGYQSGVGGWWQYLRLDQLSTDYISGAVDTKTAVDTFLRRVRPGARLRQCEEERLHWVNRVRQLETENITVIRDFSGTVIYTYQTDHPAEFTLKKGGLVSPR